MIMALCWQQMYAQQKEPEPQLTKEQELVFEMTRKTMLARGDNAATQLFLSNYRKLLASNITCCDTCGPSVQLNLNGRRIDEFNTLVEWDISQEIKGTRYIIERRFDNPNGDFDSISVIEGHGAATDYAFYNFSDKNDHPGVTWYRLRHESLKDDLQKLVKVDGYNNTIRVFPNPVTSTDLRLALTRFKISDKNVLVIRDAKGRVVYHRQQVVLTPGASLMLQDLRLVPGVYYAQLTNEFNTGGTSFVVQ